MCLEMAANKEYNVLHYPASKKVDTQPFLIEIGDRLI